MVERADFKALLAEVRAATAEIEAETLKQRESNAAERAARSDDDEKLATMRRNGEYGRDWQVLQQRIDMNRTTMDDIISGVDKSEEARAVRKILERDVLPRAREGFAAAMASDDLTEDIAITEKAEKDLAETIARLRKSATSS